MCRTVLTNVKYACFKQRKRYVSTRILKNRRLRARTALQSHYLTGPRVESSGPLTRRAVQWLVDMSMLAVGLLDR